MNGSIRSMSGLEMYDIHASGIGRPRSTAGTLGCVTQMSARALSIGIDVIEKSPSKSPH